MAIKPPDLLERELLSRKRIKTSHGWKKIAEDRAGRADTRPAQSFGPETVFAPCQRREHHLFSSSSIRGFLTSGLPAKVQSLRKPSCSQHTPANARVQGLWAISFALGYGSAFSHPPSYIFHPPSRRPRRNHPLSVIRFQHLPSASPHAIYGRRGDLRFSFSAFSVSAFSHPPSSIFHQPFAIYSPLSPLVTAAGTSQTKATVSRS